MQMGQQDVDPGQMRRQLVAEPADAGTGVEHQHRAVLAAHLDARGIAAEVGGVGSRGRHGTAGAEQGHAHSWISQNRAAAPTNSPCNPMIGMDVTSMCRRTPSMPWM